MISALSAALLVDGVAVDVVSFDVSLDETRYPYAQATVVVGLPDGFDEAHADPRQHKRISLTLTQTFHGTGAAPLNTLAFYTKVFGGQRLRDIPPAVTPKTLAGLTALLPDSSWNTPTPADRVRSFNLGIMSFTRSQLSDEARIVAASDETVLVNNSLPIDYPLVPTNNDLRYLVQEVLALENTDTILIPGPNLGAPTAKFELEAGTWEPGVMAWDLLTPLLEQGGLRLWCDELQAWHLEPAGKTSTTVAELAAADNIKDADTVINLDSGQFYDCVIVTYKWTDSANVQQARYDHAQTGSSPSKTLVLNYTTPWPGSGAAQRILSRATGRGREYAITATTDYRVSPGQIANVTLPTDPMQTGFVSGVSWRSPEDDMAVVTRGLTDAPPRAWAFIRPGTTWEDVPAGVTWATYNGGDDE